MIHLLHRWAKPAAVGLSIVLMAATAGPLRAAELGLNEVISSYSLPRQEATRHLEMLKFDREDAAYLYGTESREYAAALVLGALYEMVNEQFTAARASASRGLAILRHSAPEAVFDQSVALWILGQIALLSGEPAEAITILTATRQGLQKIGRTDPVMDRLLSVDLAEAYLEAKMPDEAVTAALRALPSDLGQSALRGYTHGRMILPEGPVLDLPPFTLRALLAVHAASSDPALRKAAAAVLSGPLLAQPDARFVSRVPVRALLALARDHVAQEGGGRRARALADRAVMEAQRLAPGSALHAEALAVKALVEMRADVLDASAYAVEASRLYEKLSVSAPDSRAAPSLDRRAAWKTGMETALTVLARAAADGRLNEAGYDAAFGLMQIASGAAVAEAAEQVLARSLAGRAGLEEAVRGYQDALGTMAREREAFALAIAAQDEHTTLTAGKDVEAAEVAVEAATRRLRQADPRVAAILKPQLLSIEAARKLLKPDEATLIVVPGAHASHVLALSSNRVMLHQAAATRDALTHHVQSLRAAIRETEAARTVEEGAALFQELVEPVAAVLHGRRTLLVAVTDPLSAIPFDVLVTGAMPPGGSSTVPWLIRSHGVLHLPSVQYLRIREGLVRQSAERAPFVGFGAPILPPLERGFGRRPFGASAVDAGRIPSQLPWRANLQQLPDAQEEIDILATGLGAAPSDVYTGAAASETAVKTAALARYSVVAFATHGLVAEAVNVNEPGLVLTPPADPTDVDDGYLTASEAAKLDLGADVVLLSACDTAAADGRPGGEPLSGLGSAFLYAGAEAVLATHWRVDSAATVDITSTMLHRWKDGADLGRGLRDAKLKLIEGELGARYQAPRYWAPFVVVGLP